MNKSNQIKNKIQELEAGKFQRLCDDLLYKKGYRNLNAIGMMATADRVRTGTPDSLIQQDDGSYIFAEYTAQQSSLLAKAEEDITKCFDETKTGILISDISAIIYCYTGSLDTHEISNLRQICQKQSINLELHSLDSIALSIAHDYPVLAEEHLSIALDSGQILSPDEFIERYNRSDYTTPIDHPILFRDEEIDRSLSSLDHKDCLLISGPTGTGKTLFAINLAKHIANKNPELKVLCILINGGDLERDITAYLSEPGHYVVFVDDANRLDQRLDYILHYLNRKTEERSYKIIATVRDYARNQILEKVTRYTNIQHAELNRLEDNQIAVITEDLFNIKNSDFLDRIVEISKGNPRIAFMAAEVAVKENDLVSIQNVASIYDKYFEVNENIGEVIGDEKLLVIAAIISFYRHIDKSNEIQESAIFDAFGLSAEEFWPKVGILHKNEIVDLHENQVVKISDQVLSTYLFYQCVFSKKLLPFSLFVDNFFPSMSWRLVGVLNPILNAFDHKEVLETIRKDILKIYEEKTQHQTQREILTFLSSFCFILPTEALIYAEELINNLPQEGVEWQLCDYEVNQNSSNEPLIIELLSKYRHMGGDEFSSALDLLLVLVTKSDNYLKPVLNCFCFSLLFTRHDYRYGYKNQTVLLEKLIQKIENGNNYLFSKISIEVCKAFLKLEHSETEYKTDRTINYITFQLPVTDQLLDLRNNIFSIISILIDHGSYKTTILDVLRDYSYHLNTSYKTLFEAETSNFEKLVVDKLSKSKLGDCLTMLNICERLDELGFEYSDSWHSDFESDKTDLVEILLFSENRRLMREHGYEEHLKLQNEMLQEHFTDDTESKFKALVSIGEELEKFLSGRDKNYVLGQGIELSMKVIAESQPNTYLNCLEHYFSFDSLLHLSSDHLLSLAFKIKSEAEVYKLIISSNLEKKDKWLTSYFVQLPENQISQDTATQLVTHFEEIEIDSMPPRIGFLDKYRQHEPVIFEKIVNILIGKSKVEPAYGLALFDLFNGYSEINKKLYEIFPLDSPILFDAYLCALTASQETDFDGLVLSKLVEQDPAFLLKFVDRVYELEAHPSFHSKIPDLNFLWARPDHIEIVMSLVEYITQSLDTDFPRLSNTLLEKLFPTGDGLSRAARTPTAEVKTFLEFAIEKHHNDKSMIHGLFNIIKKMLPDVRLNMISLLINFNKDIEIFKYIELLPNSGWSGSRVPTLIADLEFLEKLLQLLIGIEYLQHKNLVIQYIEETKERISREKKRDFTGEF